MNTDASPQNNASEAEAESHADAMKDQLQKDVASWREGRNDAPSRAAGELGVAVARPTAPARAKRAKPAAPEAPEAVDPNAAKKPFGMSYDGSTNADYIKHMQSRGAR